MSEIIKFQATPKGKQVKPDLEQAQAFLDLLDPFSGFTFQTFDDDKDRKDAIQAKQRDRGVKPYDPRAKIFNGILEDHATALAGKNADRAGVFVTVNETDGTGRKAENITRIRGVFVEIDNHGNDLEEMQAEASTAGKRATTVESSPGLYHFYLLTDQNDITKEEFPGLQKAFIRKMERFGSDPQVNDLPRVMRLPGFHHCKRDPFMTRLVEEGGRFTAQEIREALAPFMEEEGGKEKTKAASSGVDIEYELEGFHATVNRTALRNLSAWVPLLFPTASEKDGVFRVSSAELGRDLQEDLSFHPKGIKDFGTGPGLTAIDAMMRHAHDLRAQQGPNYAAFALCDAMGLRPENIGWNPRPGDDLAKWRGVENAAPAMPVSREARSLAAEITRRLHEMLQLNQEERAEDMAKVQADAQVIESMIRGSFWSGGKSKVFLLNHGQSLVQFVSLDAYKFLAKTFGQVIDPAPIEALAEGMSFGGEEGSMAEQERRRKFIGACMYVAKDLIVDHLKYHNQRDSVEWRVDMFATTPRLDLVEDRARIVLTHRPFEAEVGFDQEVVDDYRQHFTRFDEFLTFLVMARFAIDRKKAYLWILAPSDWGKGLLIDGILGSLNAKVETSVKEIEAMFEGKPVGRAPEEFKRAFALVVNEFKSIKAEIKQLESTVTLAPKHQLSSSVEVFAKVFTSAESVASLVTENGVEDQFANRMSIFEEHGSIEVRPVWQAKGKTRYVTSLTAYAAGVMNREIARMQALGRTDAQTEADRWLDAFIKRNGLDTLFERFSESLPQVAADIVKWVLREQGFNSEYLLREGSMGPRYLKSPNLVIDNYLERHFDRAEIGAYRKRKREIIAHMSVNGEGMKPHRVNGSVVKAVRLVDTNAHWSDVFDDE